MTNDNPDIVLPVTRPPRQSYRGLLYIVGLALAYLIASKLSYFTRIPPGYAATIWPPAGIALAAMLVYGYRIWPGVMLGTLMVNGLISEVIGSITENLLSVLINLAISSGATLQALAGAYLVKRFAGYPNGLIRAKDIIRFWLTGGVLAALINSTLAVTLFVAIGTTAAADFVANWATWWLGDALGVMLFTPLTLAWLYRADPVWHKRKELITLPMVVMFLLTLTAASYENQQSQQRLKLALDHEAQTLSATLENALFAHINVLHALDSFYQTSNEVTRTDFKTFTTGALKQLPGIQALSWSTVINASQREAYEATIKGEGYPNFQITEQDIKQQRLTAENRPEYVPVTFIEPYQGNEKALGFDNYSSAVRQETFKRARDSGELTLTARLMLVQNQSRHYGVLAVIPVYGNGRPHQSLAERRENITGYVVAAFNIEAIIAAVIKNSPTADLSYKLLDQSAPAAEQLLYLNAPSEPKPSASAIQIKSFFNNPSDLLSATTLNLGGRSWRLEISLTPHYIAQQRSNSTWLLLLSGLLLTSLVSAFTLMASGQGRLLQLLVTDRTAALQAGKRRFDSTFNAAPLAIANMSPQGDCLEVNQYFCEFIGYSQAETLTLSCLQLLHPDYHPLNNEKFAQCLSGELSGFTVENQYQHKLGHPLWGKLTVKLIRTETGEADYFIKMIEDITARKAIEQALYQANTLKNAMFNSRTFSSIATDAKGIIQIFNIGAENMLGYSADEVLNRLTPTDFSDPEELLIRAANLSLELGRPITPGFDALVFKAAQGIEDIEELTYIHKDGHHFPVIMSVTALRDAEDRIIGYLLIGTNNTERKQLQTAIVLNQEKAAKLLLEKEQAEYLLTIKSHFIATMSHEIRTPMSAIIGLSQLALNQTLPTETQNYLTNINAAAKSLMNILNDILDFSKLDAGRLIINSAPFPLNQLLDTLYSLFIDAAKAKGLSFNIEVASNIPGTLIGDRLRLQQILSNLLGNAIKFTAHGAITFNITLLQIDLSQVRLLFCVSDTGIGISPEDQSKLFKPFNQVDGSITRRFGGTGLGLAISHNLLELMDSEFSLTSTKGLGSTFSFELTLAVSTMAIHYQVPEPSATQTLTTAYQQLVGARILVVEDDLLLQQVIREYLTPSGAIVTIANNGQEALALLSQHEFDGILMDVHMPVMNGFEATQRLRNLPGLATLPVLALSAGVTSEEQAQCLAVGMNAFISKPIDSNQLLLTLAQWLEPERDSHQLLQCAIELDVLLQEQDFISEALLSTLKTHLPSAQHDGFTHLHQLIQDLGYQEARTVLHQLITLPNTQETL